MIYLDIKIIKIHLLFLFYTFFCYYHNRLHFYYFNVYNPYTPCTPFPLVRFHPCNLVPLIRCSPDHIPKTDFPPITALQSRTWMYRRIFSTPSPNPLHSSKRTIRPPTLEFETRNLLYMYFHKKICRLFWFNKNNSTLNATGLECVKYSARI